MPWRLWLALCIAVHGTLAADVRRSRQLTQTADTDVALQVHLSEPALLRDERTCYTEGQLVKRGTPVGCGRGCQYANAITFVSSDFEGVTTKDSAAGPPDVYPNAFDSVNAWTPYIDNDGIQTMEFTIRTPVYVSGLHVYETYHPGAVVQIQGRNGDSDPWVTIWEGEPSVPEGSGIYNTSVGTISSTARVFRPPVKAPRGQLLSRFRLTLDTTAANGYNEIDAVMVLGDDVTGALVEDRVPLCSSLADTDCWYSCSANDVVNTDRIEATLDVVAGAMAWVGRAFKVAARPGGRIFITAPPLTDASYVMCNDVEVPSRLTTQGVAASMVLFVTARPTLEHGGGPTDRTLPSASACRLSTNMADLGRPEVIHLNVPPRYAVESLAEGDTAARDAVDGVIHHLYKAMGWGAEYHTSFLGSKGTDIVECPNAPGTCDTYSTQHNKEADWTTRQLYTVKTPAAMARASEHFGATVPYVELENSGGPGIQGVLLEDRIYYGEVMTFPTLGKRLYRSAVSMGLLQDTGWYFPNYEQAEPLLWGHDMGRDFFVMACNQWPLAAKHYVCPMRDFAFEGQRFDITQAGIPACVGDRTSKGTCGLMEYPRPLHPPFQYFRTPMEANYGGTDAMRDYCPFNVPTADGSGLCTDSGNTGSYYEAFGEAARCFEVTWKGDESPGCLRHRCSEGLLYLKLGAEYVACPVDGGMVTSVSEAIDVMCPKASTLCDSYMEIPPAIMINTPVNNREIQPDITASFEFANFQVPRDGEVRITVGGRVHQTWTGEGSDPANPIKTTTLRPLPTGRLVIGFHLFNHKGDELNVEKVIVNVVPSVTAWATTVVDFSSEDPTRPVRNVLGLNNTHRYQQSAEAWSPLVGGSGAEFVEVSTPFAFHASQVHVWENFSPGGLRVVYARNKTDNSLMPVWAGGGGESAAAATAPALGSTYAPTVVGPREETAVMVLTDTYRLEFVTPSWFEIDAVRFFGLLRTEPKLTAPHGPRSVVTLRAGTVDTHSVTLQNHGTSTLYWQVDPGSAEGFPVWLEPLNATGTQFGVGEFQVVFELDATQLELGTSSSATTVRVVNTYGVGGTSLMDLDVVLQVDHTLHSQLNPAPCYNGVVVGYTDVSQGTCRCHQGAYGVACEFRHCPGNCSAAVSTVAGMPAPDLKRGHCDVYSGTCQCAPGYSGLDCSGQDGDCYISFDGSCRPGWEQGSYVLNSEDAMNLNMATGLLPEALQCDKKAPGLMDYGYGCDTMVHFTFCCRPVQTPTCAFHDGAAPCAAGLEACFASYAFNTSCLATVQAYCFEAPGDSACNAFRPIAPPPGYCPEPLIMRWCSLHPTDQSCTRVFSPRTTCMFTPVDGWSPCDVAACAQNVLSDDCEPWLVAHCQAHPEDRECDQYGYGDGCLFLPGAPPCKAPACNTLPEAYDEQACDAVVHEYCGGVLATPDPECSALGYGVAAPDALPAYDTSLSCPWDAAAKMCAEDPGLAWCIRLNAIGLNVTDMTSRLQSNAAVLADSLTQAADARTGFSIANAGLGQRRRNVLCRAELTESLWATANADDDGVLTPSEIAVVLRAASATVLLDRRFHGTPRVAVLADMLDTIGYGEYITKRELGDAVAAYFVTTC